MHEKTILYLVKFCTITGQTYGGDRKTEIADYRSGTRSRFSEDRERADWEKEEIISANWELKEQLEESLKLNELLNKQMENCTKRNGFS